MVEFGRYFKLRSKNDRIMGLNDRIINSKKVRNGVYAYRLLHGGIEIGKELYIGYSLTDAIRLWRQKNKLGK